MIRKIFLFTLALLMTGALAFAKDETKPVKMSGYLIDNMCAAEHKGDAEAKNHEASCALACAKSGFAIASGDQTYKLDKQGNEAAMRLYKATKNKKGMKVDVEGTLEGDTLHVVKITEAAS